MIGRRGFIAGALGLVAAALVPFRSKAAEYIVPKGHEATILGRKSVTIRVPSPDEPPQVLRDGAWETIRLADPPEPTHFRGISPRYSEVLEVEWRKLNEPMGWDERRGVTMYGTGS